jgi:hypothetical protein
MSYKNDPLPRSLADAAMEPPMLGKLVQILGEQWDSDGVIGAALATRALGNDPTRPRDLAAVAKEAAGILSSGGTQSDVSGYLKREELALFGPIDDDAVKTDRRQRRELVKAALWLAVRTP